MIIKKGKGEILEVLSDDEIDISKDKENSITKTIEKIKNSNNSELIQIEKKSESTN